MKDYNTLSPRLLSLRLAKKLILGLVIILVFDFILFPVPSYASAENNPVALASLQEGEDINASSNLIITNNLPVNNDLEVEKTGFYTATAYTSEVAQCDGSPCITANGFNLCEHGVEDSIAANFLPFGTKVKLPEIYGDQVFIVRDRMNERYSDRIDIWMKDKADAIKFGIKVVKIEILH